MHEQHARYEKGHIDMDTRPTKATRIKVASAGVAMVGALAIALASAGPAAGHGWEAKAVLRDVKGARVGTVRFEGNDDGTKVKVVVHGITVGRDDFHGLHIHANKPRGTCTPPFTDAGGHWNPGGATHGHHAGDLPSLLVQADRTGRATTVTGRFDPDDIKGKPSSSTPVGTTSPTSRSATESAPRPSRGRMRRRWRQATPASASPAASSTSTEGGSGRNGLPVVCADRHLVR